MDPILRQSKTTSFFSIQFVVAGQLMPDKIKHVEFQKALLETGMDFSQTANLPKGFQLHRDPPSPLQITIDSPGPQVHSLQIVSANPGYDLDMFCRDAEAVTEAYQQTWPLDQYQILNTNAKIRHLYSAQAHAFKYLWENRLKQSPEDFKALGNRPVSGGGLRLMMPPHAIGGSEPVSIELRIESFLREPTKLLVETAFAWPKPRTATADSDFDSTKHLEEVEQFAANEAWNFIIEKAEDPGIQ